MTLELGAVFWKDDCNGGHFCVVITPPTEPQVLIVNITSQGPRKDQSCVLTAGCHPRVDRESVICFDDADVFETSTVSTMLGNGTFDEKEKASRELILKIWEGASKTNRMKVKCKELFEKTIPN